MMTHPLAVAVLASAALQLASGLKECVNEQLGCAQSGSPFCTKPGSYAGAKAVTVSGKPCQSWQSQTPNAHRYTEVEGGAVCRNPDGDAAPWCYVDDPNVRWEYCFKACSPCHDPSKNCVRLGSLACQLEYEYAGTANATHDGRPCQKWANQEPNVHRWTNLPGNYGRNPDRQLGPWCYVAQDQEKSNKRWDYVLDDCSGCTCPEVSEFGVEEDFGEILSPRRQNQYCDNLDCRYKILKGSPGENLAITLHYLQTEAQSDYLEVSFVKKDAMFPGAEEKVLFKRLSGYADEQTWIFSDDGQVELLFHTDGSSQGRGFHLSFLRYPKEERPCDCPLTFETVSKPQPISIRNPQYEESRACKEMKCQFYLRAENASQSVEMAFPRLDLGASDYSRHSLYIHEGNRSLAQYRVKVLNGSTPANWVYVSAGSQVLLEYQRSNESEHQGFVAAVAQKPGPCKCSNVTLTEVSGSFASPGYPETFCPNMECFVRIEVPTPFIQLRFDELDLPGSGRLAVAGPGENFTHPRVFFDTKNVRLAQQPFTIDSNVALLQFKSADFAIRKGFKVSYEGIATPKDCRCPPISEEVLGAVSGTLEASACGPLDCFFYLPPKDSTNRIHLWLEQLEIAANGTENYVAVLNRGFRARGPQPVAVRTFDAQRRDAEKVVASVSNQGALIHYHIAEAFDGAEMKSGFRLRWRWDLKDCGSGIRDLEAGSSGNLSSPNFPREYDSNLRCLWRFRAPAGYAVRVRVVAVGTEECCDHLRVFDGPDTSEASRRASLKAADVGRVITGNGTQLLIQFNSDGSVQASGWNLTYEVVPSEGGGPVMASCSSQAEHLIALEKYLLFMKLYKSQLSLDEAAKEVIAKTFLSGVDDDALLKKPRETPKVLGEGEKVCAPRSTANFGAQRAAYLAQIADFQQDMEVETQDMGEELVALKQRYAAPKLSRDELVPPPPPGLVGGGPPPLGPAPAPAPPNWEVEERAEEYEEYEGEEPPPPPPEEWSEEEDLDEPATDAPEERGDGATEAPSEW